MIGSPLALKYAERDLATLWKALTLCPGRTACVQAGGNLGVFPAYLAQHFTRVVTFEPDPELFVTMTANAPQPNIIRFQAALGAGHGAVSTCCARRDGSGKPIHEGLTHIVAGGIVPMVTLDALGLDVLDLFILDVEGFEFFALHGALQTLKRCRPVLMVEVNARHLSCYDVTPEDIRDLLTDEGYCLAFTQHSDEVYVRC